VNLAQSLIHSHMRLEGSEPAGAEQRIALHEHSVTQQCQNSAMLKIKKGT